MPDSASSCSGVPGLPTRYRSVAQSPKSTVLHRSEQKGLATLTGSHLTGLPQRGQLTTNAGIGRPVKSEIAERQFEFDVGVC